MAKIKKLGFLNFFRLKHMKPLVDNTAIPCKFELIMLYPLCFIQSFLHIKLKKLPESYISIEDKSINGVITVQAEYGNPYKWNIKHLYLTENSFAAGRQLVDYILAEYGAKGANTFCVTFNDQYEELLDLFSKGCGFRLCSHESLWKMNQLKASLLSDTDNIFRPFKNSDAKEVCELYNDSIYPHFRYSLSKSKSEFYDRIFQGISRTSHYKYVMCDSINKKIKGFIEIQTNDNKNYLLDIVSPLQYEELYGNMYAFALSQISRRTKDFNLMVLSRNYMSSAKKTEEYLKDQKFSMIHKNVVLVKDFFKTIKQEEKISKPAIAFSEINRKPAFKLPSGSTS